MLFFNLFFLNLVAISAVIVNVRLDPAGVADV